MNENNVNNNVQPVNTDVSQPAPMPAPAASAQPAPAPTPAAPSQPAPEPVNNNVNKPMQTIDNGENDKIAPNSVINTENINTNANSPTNIDDIQINTVTIDASSEITAKEYVEKEKYKLTGTADEADLKLDENEKKEEVLDELQIKREVQKENEKFKKDLIYIATFIGILFIGIAVLPYIVKIVGIKSVN